MEDSWWTKPEDLDASQTAVVALSPDEDHLVLGPAGSGKTNLLILRAAYLYGAGSRNIALLTFGRVLREFLVAGAGNYQLPPNRIQTYIGWGRRLLNENEIQFDDAGSFEDVRRRLLTALTDLAALNRPENVLDAILLDEVQDYTPEELAIIRRFARRVFAVGDERQRIYRGEGAIAYLRRQVRTVSELPYHYRNGFKICRVADGIRNLVDSDQGMASTSNYDEKKNPSSVIIRPDLSIDEQIAAAIPDIERQLRAYPTGLVGVLSPRNQEVTAIWDRLSASPIAGTAQLFQSGEGYGNFNKDSRVVVATTHGAKGLEFRALHLLGMEHLSKFQGRQKNLAYTSVTRAKTSLTIYHDGPIPAYLDSGVSAAKGGIATPPQLKDLFRPGGG